MFECIFVGDTGSGNDDQISVTKSMEKIISKNPIQTVIIVGDNIYPDGCESIDDELFETNFDILVGRLCEIVKFVAMI